LSLLRGLILDNQLLFHDARGAAAFHKSALCALAKIVQREPGALFVHGHLVRGSPPAGRIVAAGHIESGREGPTSVPVHQEGDVLDVIVLVAGDGSTVDGYFCWTFLAATSG